MQLIFTENMGRKKNRIVCQQMFKKFKPLIYQLRLFNITEFMFEIFNAYDVKNIGIRKSEFVAKNQRLSLINNIKILLEFQIKMLTFNVKERSIA